MSDELNQYLKEKRIAKGISQLQIAQALGYTTAQYVSNVERNRCVAPLNSLRVWCDLIDADPEKCKKILIKEYKKVLNSVL